ncbi:restriction endonuclease subunit S [Planosporangium flavigriseum]|nr:restriction endonuclease subunit S [Planosporangium flavigriseum]
MAIPNIVDGRLDLNSVRRITQQDFELWTRRTKPRQGDLIITRRGRVGDTAAVPRGLECAIGQNLVIARSDGSRIDQRYLRWATRGEHWESEVDRLLNVGAVFSSLNVRDIPRIRVYVPPMRMQRGIADALDALDDKIAVNERIAATARELGLNLVRQALETRSHEHEVGALAELISRGVTPRYSLSDNDLLVLNQKCIRNGRVSLEPGRFTLRDKVPDGKKLRLHDILVNSTGVGTLGRVARWTLARECTVDTHVTIVRFDPAKTDQVCAGFAMLLAQPAIEAMGEGSTGQTELSRVKLAGMRLRLPDSEAMGNLRPALDVLEARGDQALAESRDLGHLRDALLPKLVSGEIRVREVEKVVEDAT